MNHFCSSLHNQSSFEVMKHQTERSLNKRYYSGLENTDFLSCCDKCCKVTSSQDVVKNKLNSPPEQLSSERALKDTLLQIRGIKNLFEMTEQ